MQEDTQQIQAATIVVDEAERVQERLGLAADAACASFEADAAEMKLQAWHEKHDTPAPSLRPPVSRDERRRAEREASRARRKEDMTRARAGAGGFELSAGHYEAVRLLLAKAPDGQFGSMMRDVFAIRFGDWGLRTAEILFGDEEKRWTPDLRDIQLGAVEACVVHGFSRDDARAAAHILADPVGMSTDEAIRLASRVAIDTGRRLVDVAFKLAEACSRPDGGSVERETQ
jgi:hypothetical protein